MTEIRLHITDGVVTNVSVVDPNNVPDWMADNPVAPEGVGIGWIVTAEGYDPPPAPPDIPAPLPAELTKLQIRDQAVATDAALWPAIKTFIDADPDRAERWALAIGIPTDDPILDDLQTALEWTDEQRTAFIVAAGAR